MEYIAILISVVAFVLSIIAVLLAKKTKRQSYINGIEIQKIRKVVKTK